MLLGRAQECDQIERLLADGRAGESRALVIRGEPGVGKTALLEYAVEHAEGYRVLSTLGLESESEMAYSGLFHLVWPIAHQSLDPLPPAQRRALRCALALDESGPADRLAVCAATLTLLAAAAEGAPLLCVADDAQWLDSESAEALHFAARRIEADRVVMLFAIRDQGPSGFPARGLDGLSLQGLDPAAATALLEAHCPRPLAAAVASTLARITHGNPLAMIELPSVLSDSQIAGSDPIDDPLPVGESLERAFLTRARALSDAAQSALLVAAAADRTDFATVVAAAGGSDGIDEAEAAGLIRVHTGSLEFRHPLVRSAVYWNAPAGARRAAHAALARSSPPDRPEQRAWHRAMATLGTDEQVAADLEVAAQAAGGRGGAAAEARLYARAARITPDPDRRWPRLLAGGRAAYRAGLHDLAAALLDEALAGSTDLPLQADLLDARLFVARAQGALGEWIDRCLAMAAELEPVDPRRSARLLFQAWDYSYELWQLGRARELASRAWRLVAAEPDLAAIGEMCWQRVADGDVERVRELALAGSKQLADGPAEQVADLVECLVFIDDHAAARDMLQPALPRLREAGAVVALVRALAALSLLELRTSRLAQASAAAHEAVMLAEEYGLEYWRSWSLSRLADVEAELGREENCRRHAAATFASVQHTHDHLAEAVALEALGRLELGLGRVDDAIATLERLSETVAEVRHPGMFHWPADLAEAYVRAGRPADAGAVIADLDARADGCPWARGAVARGRATLAPDGDLDRAFTSALEHWRSPASHLDRARTQLSYGERLRRAGRRSDARRQLRAALATFERLGSGSSAGRARAELEASGETARRRDPGLTDQLTPRELQVALAVAAGKTNREAGAALFLSPKTVELHLSRVYRKLGVRSRTELARRLPAGDSLTP
jgi:DNA-binding CsgD family transcriptional regulator